MFLLRRSDERGHLDHGWLDTYHSFSFAHYTDPDWMGFGPLRVINEDRIAGKKGFCEHFHNDMEIITYVIEGALEHKDNLGNGSIIRLNQVQHMSAGTGVLHSEFNPADETVHLLQIWIEPNVLHAVPRYEERELSEVKSDALQLIVSPNGQDGSIAIRQDAKIYRGMFEAGRSVDFSSAKGRKQWVQVISGELGVGSELLKTGDACGIEGEMGFVLAAKTASHFLVFDLPGGPN